MSDRSVITLAKVNRGSCFSIAQLLVVFSIICMMWGEASLGAVEPVAPLIDAHTIEAWKVEATAGDSVKLRTEGPVLVADFDVDINVQLRQGHQVFNEKRFNLWLVKPIKLETKIERLLYEAMGHQSEVQIWPVIRDASGELLSYMPSKAPHLMAGSKGWSQWMTPNFFAGEAGGATHDICQAQDGNGNSWPDGTLEFVGFRVVLRKSEFGKKIGRIAIGQVFAEPMQMPYSDPFFYADSALSKAGTYRLGASVANGFQTPPLRELSQTFTFDPQSVTSCRQRLTIPLGPDDDYWINYQITDESGRALTDKDLRFRVNGAPDRQALKPVDTTLPPPTGLLRLSPGGKAGGVFEIGEPLSASIRVFAPKATNPATTTLRWRLTPYAFDMTLKEGQQTLGDFKEAYRDIAWNNAGDAPHDAYQLKVELSSDGKVIDRRELVLGRKTNLSKPRTTRVGRLPVRERFKNTSYYRCSYVHLESQKFTSEDQAVADFEKSLDEGGGITPNWTYMIDAANFEILPGVYDFALLDRLMDAAWDRGMALTIRIGHADQNGLFRWLRYSRQYCYDGLEIDEHYYGGFALTDKNFIEAWHRNLKALFDRYREHPAFQGYYLMQPAGEATVEDKPYLGIIAGYEPPMREAFRIYLRDTLKLSLEKLNERWSTNYSDWQQVLPPLPDLHLGKMPDLSMRWVDFCNLKIQLDAAGWFPEAAQRIRTYDPQRVVIVYGGTRATKELAGLVDYFHNGGNHFLQDEGTLIDPWEKGKTGWINEPHHPHRWAAYGDPTGRGWVLDWTIYVAMAQAGGGGANMHVYYDARYPYQKHFGGNFAYDRMMKYRPILDEMLQVKLVGQVTQVATMQDELTLACKHRTTFFPRAFDLRRWFELLKKDSIPFEDYREEHANQYKLILPNVLDEVMSQDNILAVDHAVRDRGCKAIISAITGKYCPQRGNQPHQLLRQLGIEPPQGEYVQSDAGVEASVTEENPLLPRGFKIPFMTLEQIHDESVNPKIDFWNWPFRFIPLTDYFGYYRDNKKTNGTVLARFAGGGVAMSSHKVGKGEVIVLWGIPNYRTDTFKGMMDRASQWAGITNPLQGNPAPLMLEGFAAATGRRYAILFHEATGRISQKIPTIPDGKYFVEELVADQKLGTWTGKEIRESGVAIDFVEGGSPLKILRLRPPDSEDQWAKKYRLPTADMK